MRSRSSGCELSTAAADDPRLERLDRVLVALDLHVGADRGDELLRVILAQRVGCSSFCIRLIRPGWSSALPGVILLTLTTKKPRPCGSGDHPALALREREQRLHRRRQPGTLASAIWIRRAAIGRTGGKAMPDSLTAWASETPCDAAVGDLGRRVAGALQAPGH